MSSARPYRYRASPPAIAPMYLYLYLCLCLPSKTVVTDCKRQPLPPSRLCLPFIHQSPTSPTPQQSPQSPNGASNDPSNDPNSPSDPTPATPVTSPVPRLDNSRRHVNPMIHPR
jgi:hypothetical protein